MLALGRPVSEGGGEGEGFPEPSTITITITATGAEADPQLGGSRSLEEVKSWENGAEGSGLSVQ